MPDPAGAADVREVGTVLKGGRILLRLGLLDGDLTFSTLGQYLFLGWDDLFEAIVYYPENEPAFRALYADREKRSAGGKLPLRPMKDADGRDEPLEILRGNLVEHAEYHRTDDPAFAWIVPKRTIQVPHSNIFKMQLRQFKAEAGQRRRLTVGDLVFLQDEVARLQSLTKKLQNALTSYRLEVRAAAEQVELLVKMRLLVRLQREVYEDGLSVEARDDAPKAKPALDGLDAAIAKLEDAARTYYVSDRHLHAGSAAWKEAESTAAAILDLLKGEELVRQAGIIALNPSVLTPAEQNDLLRALRSAAMVMMDSPRAREFQQSHLLPALARHLATEPAGWRKKVQAAIGDTELRNAVETGWADALERLTKGAIDAHGVLGALVVGAGGWKAVTSVFVGALEIGAPRIVGFLYDAHKSGKPFAGLVLRLILLSSPIHDSNLDVLAVIGPFTENDPTEVARRIREWELHRWVLKGGFGVGVSLLANIAVLSSVLTKDEELSVRRCFEIAAALVDAGAAGLDLAATKVYFDQNFKLAWKLRGAAENAGRLATVIGLVASVLSAQEHWEKSQDAKVWLDVVGIASTLVTMASWAMTWQAAPWFAATEPFAPHVALAGAILGLAVFTVTVIDGLTTPGPQQLVEAYWEHFVEKSGLLSPSFGHQSLKEDVDRTLEVVSTGGGALLSSWFQAPKKTTAKADALVYRDAFRRGLSRRDVITFFEASPASVTLPDEPA